MFQTRMWLPSETQTNSLELTIQGNLPKNLRGAYYRNGPNPFILNQPNYHQFDGDGMIHCIQIERGKAFYTNRWVGTDKFLIESRFQKKVVSYYKEYLEKYAGPVSEKRNQMGPSNTNVVFFNKKLFALSENCPPLEIEPLTCKTLDKWDYLGNESWKMMTAHPKLCPLTHQFNTYSYNPINGELFYYRLDQRGNLLNKFQINLAYKPLLIHDFAITRDYVIFAIFPLIIEPSILSDKTNQIVWRSELKSQLIVCQKCDGRIIYEEKFHPYFSFHFINAYQMEKEITIDLFLYEDGITGEEFWEPIDKPNYPYRLNICLNKKKIRIEKLTHISGDFATIEPTSVGQEYDYFIMNATFGGAKKYEYNSVVLFDIKNRTYKKFQFDEFCYCSESLLVLVPNKSNNIQKFILTLVYNTKTDNSYFYIFEPDKMEDGPVCRLSIAKRIPFGFHGVWVPQAF